MTIDTVNFEMTLEVLGEGEDAREFFRTYETETRKDLEMMRACIDSSDWNKLKRLCHTWKGRASQIGFRKSAHLAASLHDFLQQSCCGEVAKNKETAAAMEPSFNEELSRRQVEMFWETLRRECQIITELLGSRSLL